MRLSSGKLFLPLCYSIGLFQALLCWLTLTPSADSLAEDITLEIQGKGGGFPLIYPGQRHGGALEYILKFIVHRLFGINFFSPDSFRVFLAGATIVLLGMIATEFFGTQGRYWFLVASFLSPALLRVNWLMPGGYVSSWVFAMISILIFLKRQSKGSYLLVGFFAGWAIYQQPTSLIFMVALIPMILKKLSTRESSKYIVFNIALGLITPISFFAFAYATAKNVVYSPFTTTHLQISRALRALGIFNSNPSNPSTLANVVGFQNGPWALNPLDQAVLISSLLVTVYLSIKTNIKPRIRAIAKSWLIGTTLLSIYSIFVPTPSWFYGVAFTFFFILVTTSCLMFLNRNVKTILITMLISLFIFVPSVPNYNISQLRSQYHMKVHSQFIAQSQVRYLQSNKYQFVVGDYWQVYPLMYLSDSNLVAIPITFNRFKSFVSVSLSNENNYKVAFLAGGPGEVSRIVEKTLAQSCTNSSKALNLEGIALETFYCSRNVLEKINL